MLFTISVCDQKTAGESLCVFVVLQLSAKAFRTLVLLLVRIHRPVRAHALSTKTTTHIC